MFDTNASKVGFEVLRTLAFGAIPTSAGMFVVDPITFLPAGAVGVPTLHAVRALKLVNNTDQAINISYDGHTIQGYSPAFAAFTWDFATNRVDPAGIFQLPKGTQFVVGYTGAVAPLHGEVAIEVMYGAVN